MNGPRSPLSGDTDVYLPADVWSPAPAGLAGELDRAVEALREKLVRAGCVEADPAQSGKPRRRIPVIVKP